MQLIMSNYHKILKATPEIEEVKEAEIKAPEENIPVFNDGALYIFRIGKVPQELSREKLIDGITKQYGKLLFMQLVAKMKT